MSFGRRTSARTSTTRLPLALREQISKQAGGNRHEPAGGISNTGQSTLRPRKSVINRKQARKEERQQQKQRKAVFFSHPKSTPVPPTLKRPAEESQLSEPAKKKPRRSQSSEQQSTNWKFTSSIAVGPHGTQTREEAPSHVTTGLEVPLKPSSHKPLSSTDIPRPLEEDREDALIAWLETKLGTTKGKSGKRQSRSFGDGLDDLLDDIDRIVPKNTQASGNFSESDSELSEFRGFSPSEKYEDSDEGKCHVNSQIVDEAEAFGAVGVDDRLTTSSAVDVGKTTTQPQAESKYIPPHLRQRPINDEEMLSKLSRQMKGLLNRLSEQNIASIIGSIDDLYRSHRRHDITSTMTKLIVDGISSHSSHLDSYVILHASLVAALHQTLGVDFAAHFVQYLISSFELHYQVLSGSGIRGPSSGDTMGKECLNLIVLLSELYNFQVTSCVLVYDIIRSLLDTLNEFDVELLLKIVRNSGQQLRQDDPSALKDIIQVVQTKLSEKGQETLSSRTRFMIETLTNLKNNKLKRVPGQESHSESVGRLKKFLVGLSKKHYATAREPLRISLEDLRSSEKKGKWWLVGSAWGGDPLLDQAQEYDKYPASNTPSAQAANSLLQLARKQGMNTDVRRSIFVVLLSSDDYVDACERLLQLHLTEVQQREIVRVLLHCLGNEKQYNPYYTLVVQHLCQNSHSHKVTLQFCLWDFLRELGEKDVGGVEITKGPKDNVPFNASKISSTRRVNVARAYAWWISKNCCSLTILKPVDFTSLQIESREFFTDMFYQIFVSTQVSSPAIAPSAVADEYLADTRVREPLEKVFVKAKQIPTLTQGLIYFFQTNLRGDDRIPSEVVSGLLRWARDVATDTLRTDVVASLT